MGNATTTTNDPRLATFQEWNNGAVAFDGWVGNSYDSASAAGSNLLNLKLTNVSKFRVGKQGGLGAFGTAPPTAQPTVTGSRGGNAALASLLTALAATGLIIDGTSA